MNLRKQYEKETGFNVYPGDPNGSFFDAYVLWLESHIRVSSQGAESETVEDISNNLIKLIDNVKRAIPGGVELAFIRGKQFDSDSSSAPQVDAKGGGGELEEPADDYGSTPRQAKEMVDVKAEEVCDECGLPKGTKMGQYCQKCRRINSA